MIDAEALGCQEFVELVTAYLEGALGARDVRAFRGAPRRLRRLHGVPRADPPDHPRHRHLAARRLQHRGGISAAQGVSATGVEAKSS